MNSDLVSLKHLIGLLGAVGLTLFVLYISKFWIWTDLWSGDGLFGLKIILPYGDMVSWWLRHTPLRDLAIVIWGAGSIVGLSVVHWIVGKAWK